MISEGSIAPDFSLLNQRGETVSLSDFKGKKVLLVFYPGDNTPVCTAQLCSYRDNFSAFEQAGVQILGISTDSPESKKNFAEKHQFPFPILSDSDKQVSKKYGALSFLGVSQRAYVLIDEDGIVRYAHSELLPVVYRSVDELLSKVQAVSK
ncbi:MAG: peroxiredoxin [Chloroherpetonaceae bacterium]|nr:peroxiredoxin [Chloroherpetonaceae bacterium]MDW8438736.1 peroxiredoxin [Chloroherpetonaceae bacterium]